MPNWVPFACLSITSVFLLSYILVKKKEKAPKIILFWLFISGLAYLFEFVIFILLNSYEYYPEFFSSHYNDSIAGSIISQALAVPVAITLIVVFHLRFRWIFFIIGLFFLIETFFLYLDIYEHNWWKSIYTILFLSLTVMLSKVWWRYLYSGKYHYINFVTLYFAIMTLSQTIGWILSSLLGLYELPIGLFSIEIKDNVIGNGVYLFFTTYLYTLIIYYRYNDLPYTVMTLVFLLTIEIFMVNQGILFLKEPYYIFILPSLHIAFIQGGKFVCHRHFPGFHQTSQKRLLRQE
ncbi:hypothetical protein AAEO50_19410 [Rossellomorea oryzaecorticis]|uniref:Uncharacterized protein n=1 Tax=Rossellomorea oryzaecorticis TaxID=1396505 RepID=A0ABU9KI17_9BACI